MTQADGVYQDYVLSRMALVLASPGIAPAGFVLETSTPLSGGATYNGASRTRKTGSYTYNGRLYSSSTSFDGKNANTFGYAAGNRFTAQANSDVDGTLQIQYNTTGTTWATIATTAVVGGVPKRLTAIWLGNALSSPQPMRAVFINGASAQSSFRLYTWSWIEIRKKYPNRLQNTYA